MAYLQLRALQGRQAALKALQRDTELKLAAEKETNQSDDAAAKNGQYIVTDGRCTLGYSNTIVVTTYGRSVILLLNDKVTN